MSDPAVAFSPDPRRHMLAVVLMAGYALRAMNHVRREIPGGLNAAHILLDVLRRDRAARLIDSPYASPPLPSPATAANVTHSILAISAAIDVPRETVRRHLLTLTESGWLDHSTSGGYQPTDRTRRRFSIDHDVTALAELVWIADHVHATLGATGAEVERMVAGHPWHVVLATQRESLAHPPYAEAIAPLRARLVAASAAQKERLAGVADAYLYRHLRRLRVLFDGDLLLPLLIGEIAHRNISALAHNADPMPELGRLSTNFASVSPAQPLVLMPINAHSLALAMAVPDATVRRKVAHLARRGWITVAGSGELCIEKRMQDDSAALNEASLSDMVVAHRAFRAAGISL
jgi:predicted ArsR family transcriptional regulator